jgi:hypothetical protein
MTVHMLTAEVMRVMSAGFSRSFELIGDHYQQEQQEQQQQEQQSQQRTSPFQALRQHSAPARLVLARQSGTPSPASAKQQTFSIKPHKGQQVAASTAAAAASGTARNTAGGSYIGNPGFNAARAHALLAAQAAAKAAAAAAAAPAVQSQVKPQAGETSRFKGVCWNKRSQRWQAAINFRNR